MLYKKLLEITLDIKRVSKVCIKFSSRAFISFIDSIKVETLFS